MAFLTFAILGYLFLALVNIGDKLFLGNYVPNYKVYTAFIGLLGILIFILAPWFLVWPGFWVFLVSLISGGLFIVGMLSFFHALKEGEASRVIPFVGGVLPIFSLVFSVLFLNQALVSRQWLAFGLLVVGSALIVRLPHRTHWWDKIGDWFAFTRKKHHFEYLEEILLAVVAAVLLAASFVTTKYVYDHTTFWSGFIWVRLGSFLAALGLLLSRDTRAAFKKTLNKIHSKTGVLFLGNQAIGAIGFTLQSVAISLGSVAIVNALQGVQYVFVIALAAIASVFYPKLAGEEKINAKVIIEKLLAVVVIGLGLWILALTL